MADIALKEWAERGEVGKLEDGWLGALEEAEEYRNDLLDALEILNKSGKGDKAAELAWIWMTNEAERSGPDEVLGLGKELILRCGDNDEMRQEILRLYGEVFADRPEITRLIEASGLSGEKSPRRALRTLDICLHLQEGDYLISRSEERAALVTGVDREQCEYTLQIGKREQSFDPDELALKYDPVEANDYRVLSQLNPEKIPEMLNNNPVELMIGILKSNRGRIDSDRLEELLSGRFIEPDKWSGWWSKTRTAMKRCPNIVLEGRNPVLMSYNAQGQTLEDEILPQWEKAETPEQRLVVADTYLREARNRKSEIKKKMIDRMFRDLNKRVGVSRQNDAGYALAEALVIDRLAEAKVLSEKQHAPAEDIIKESNDPIRLLRSIKEHPRHNRALELMRKVRDDWQDAFATLLPFAPMGSLDLIVSAMIEAQANDSLNDALNRIPDDFTQHLDALCWLWKGPQAKGFDPQQTRLPSHREMLPKLLEHLAELIRSETTQPDVLRDARAKLRTVLSHNKYKNYQAVIEDMGDSLAFTVYWTVDRLDGLGQVVRSDMLNIIRDTYPHLFIKEKADPWTDDATVFTTEAGMNKREEELNHLLNVKIPENAKAIGEAASHGDLSENSEYKFALEERDLLQARVMKIQDELSRARTLSKHDIATDRVHIGTRVILTDTSGQQRHELTILGPWDADLERRILNYRAPMCQKLKGRSIGDTVTLDLDGGEQEYRIMEIQNALE